MSGWLEPAVALLVWPGLLGGSALAWLFLWIQRKLTARLQGRVGPPFYQPFFDFVKLLGKESVVPGGVNRRLFGVLPLVAATAATCALGLVPVPGNPMASFPGDLIVLAPVLLLVAPNSVNRVVSTAAQGGLIPWQTGLITPLGRFQFILGREVGVCFYGSGSGADSYILTDASTGDGTWTLFSMHTLHFDFPILEYRPIRTFSKRQSASLVMQVAAGLDLPGKQNIIDPPGNTVNLKPIWSLGLRFAFDWRFYYAKKRT